MAGCPVYGCNCTPEILQPCPECIDWKEYANPICFRCQGRGMVPEYAPTLQHISACTEYKGDVFDRSKNLMNLRRLWILNHGDAELENI